MGEIEQLFHAECESPNVGLVPVTRRVRLAGGPWSRSQAELVLRAARLTGGKGERWRIVEARSGKGPQTP
jgi:hypothetical protein